MILSGFKQLHQNLVDVLLIYIFILINIIYLRTELQIQFHIAKIERIV